MTMSKLQEALSGWNRYDVLGYDNADDFANAFYASPDCEDLEESHEEIVAAATAMYKDFRAETPRYIIRDDSGSRIINANNADAACAQYANAEGLRARTMADLAEEIEDQGGYLYIHEDGVLLYQTAGVHG